jgi:hypothetical protein
VALDPALSNVGGCRRVSAPLSRLVIGPVQFEDVGSRAFPRAPELTRVHGAAGVTGWRRFWARVRMLPHALGTTPRTPRYQHQRERRA